MDFDDAPDEARFRAEARAFLEAHAPAEWPDIHADPVDEHAYVELSRAWQQLCWDHGWACINWPAAWGGRDATPVQQLVWGQEKGRFRIRETLFIVGIGMAGPTLIRHGTEEQKARFLPPMARGEEVWCQLFSEPGAGSDLAALSTRAVRDGDHWVLTGQKVWSSHATVSGWGILLARTDMDAPKHKGITYFLVDMAAPGVEVRPLEQMTGKREFCEVFLDEVRVPDAWRVGAVNDGWRVAMDTLASERFAIGGVSRLFLVEELLELARAHPGRVDDRMRDELVRLYGDARALGLINDKMLTKLGRGLAPSAEASVAKLLVGRVRSRIAELALELLGPDALLDEHRWAKRWLYAPALHIAGGTDEVQKTVMAERLLGLPRGPRLDGGPFRDLPRSGVARGE